MRAWFLGYYHGVLASKPADTLWVRPMEIVRNPSGAGMSFIMRPWDEEGLARLMSRSCAADPSQRLRDAAAAITADLIRSLP